MALAQNIFIFVADSLRWDHLPQSAADRGVTFKTAAQSTFTAPSFATLVSGLYPPQHGVFAWTYRMSDGIQTILDQEDLNGGFWQAGEIAGHEIFPILRQERKTSLSDIEEPFVYLERNDDPHVPYAESDAPSAPDYYRSRGSDYQRIQREYQRGVETSVGQFEARLNELDNRGLLDDTLVIFTSDHGELLGEYGAVSHNNPASPELTFVPTVFIHDDLTREDFQVNSETDLIELADIAPTALGALGRDVDFPTAGVDLRETRRSHEWGYNHVNSFQWHGQSVYHAESVWWPDGSGHVFHRSHAPFRLAKPLRELVQNPAREAHRKRLVSYLRAYVPATVSYGDPPVSSSGARSLLATLNTDPPTGQGETAEVDLEEDVEEHLRQMGYL